jgi:hypothetical protein
MLDFAASSFLASQTFFRLLCADRQFFVFPVRRPVFRSRPILAAGSLLALSFLAVAVSSRFLRFAVLSARGPVCQVVLASVLRLAQFQARQCSSLRFPSSGEVLRWGTPTTSRQALRVSARFSPNPVHCLLLTNFNERAGQGKAPSAEFSFTSRLRFDSRSSILIFSIVCVLAVERWYCSSGIR